MVFWYVTICKNDVNQANKTKTNEVFTGFYNISDYSVSSFESLILDILKDKNISLSKCRGQWYGGANVMRGA